MTHRPAGEGVQEGGLRAGGHLRPQAVPTHHRPRWWAQPPWSPAEAPPTQMPWIVALAEWAGHVHTLGIRGPHEAVPSVLPFPAKPELPHQREGDLKACCGQKGFPSGESSEEATRELVGWTWKSCRWADRQNQVGPWDGLGPPRAALLAYLDLGCPSKWGHPGGHALISRQGPLALRTKQSSAHLQGPPHSLPGQLASAWPSFVTGTRFQSTHV